MKEFIKAHITKHEEFESKFKNKDKKVKTIEFKNRTFEVK